jgi:hypothetical protein
MTAVTRLHTFVDLADDPDRRRLSFVVRHEAVLDDGRRVLLLDDRGWAQLPHGGDPDLWTQLTAADVEHLARTVVGPDEPLDGETADEMEALHWGALASALREHGIGLAPSDLRALPHEVELGERVRARLHR